jgi:hypothetical protein
MQAVLALIPVLLMFTLLPALFGAFTIASARLLRSNLRFRHAFVFGLIMVGVSLLGEALSYLSGYRPPVLLSVVVALVVNMALGSFCFARRATDRETRPVGPRRAALIAGLGLVLFGLLAGALTLALSFRHAPQR